MGSAASMATDVVKAKRTKWLDPMELVPHLEPADLVEFQRDIFQHWALYVGKVDDVHCVVHLSGAADVGEFSTTLSGASAAPFRASARGVRAGYNGQQSTSGAGNNLVNYFKASVQSSENAEVCSSDFLLVASNSRCRVNNGQDLEYPALPVDVVLDRALGQLGARKYHILFTNCEHFVKWCRYGSKSSTQSSKVKSLVVGLAAGAVTGSMCTGVALGTTCWVACHIANRIRNNWADGIHNSW